MRLARATSRPPGRSGARPVRGAPAGVVMVLGLAVLLATGAQRGAAGHGAEPLAPDQQRELEHLLQDVADANLELDRRRRAAAILLHRGWDQAIEALAQHLRSGPDAGARRAVAQALAEAERPDQRFVEPLIDALAAEGEPGRAVRRDAAAALGRYEAPALVRRLIELARDVERPAAARRGAVAALAEHRRRDVADALVGLATDAATDESVRAEAFDALARFTGRGDLGRNAGAWARWRRQMAELDHEQWLAALMRNLSARNAELAAELATANERLVAAHQRLYEATPEEGRPAVLSQLLGEPMVGLRLLALRLIDRRILNAQPIDDTVRQAMRSRLADPEAPVRARAAELLENLADADAAQRAAELLAAEPEPSVRAAYLALLARVPRAEAVGAALELIERQELRRPAASFLLAAYDAGLMGAEQVAGAAASARRLISASPEPSLLRLLGRLGGADDLQRLVAHLADGAPSALRLAAVEALAAERWPLSPLLEYLGDAVVGPAIVGVIGRRGADADAFVALLSHEPNPDESEQGQPWRDAVVAVAGRLSAADVARADRALAEMAEHGELHERCLLAAAGLAEAGEAGGEAAADESRAGARMEAALCLGELYLRTGRPERALRVYQRVASDEPVNGEQRRRLALGRVESKLRTDPPRFDEADDATRTALDEAGDAWAAALARLWLDAAERALDAQAPAAADLLDRAATLFDGQLNGAERARLTELTERL